MNRSPIPDALEQTRVFAVIRKPALPVTDVAEALVAGGIRVLEVTMDTNRALDAIADLAAGDLARKTLIGVGTVTTGEQARSGIEAGAQFVVTPSLATEVIDVCVDAGVPVFPGSMTPSEISQAWDRGATGVKLFPAGPLGPAYLKTIRGPLSDVPIYAVGGIDAENAADFLAAGAVGIGVGTWLTGPDDAARITERSQRLMAAFTP